MQYSQQSCQNQHKSTYHAKNSRSNIIFHGFFQVNKIPLFKVSGNSVVANSWRKKGNEESKTSTPRRTAWTTLLGLHAPGSSRGLSTGRDDYSNKHANIFS